MKLPVTLERDETGMIIAECPAIPGCVSQGQTEQEAIANIREAIVGCLEVRAAQGLPLTVRTVEVLTKPGSMASLSIPDHREIAWAHCESSSALRE
jgi:predicted RNase H-like HicB family nuclease